jgi:hypothetical protein
MDRTMVVFDEFERVSASPAAHNENFAAFLNRVNTPFWEEVRRLIEDWFVRLPDEEKASIRSRLRSPDNRQFNAAFWELYLHEALTQAGYVVTTHPAVEGTDRSPDFLVEGRDQAFYMEARVASESDDEITATRRRRRVYDALDRLHSPNFWLWIDVEGEGASDLPTRNLRRKLETWLAGLDPDDIERQITATKNVRSIATFEWESEDWHLVFRPWPKPPEVRGSDDLRPLGVFESGEAGLVDDISPLKKALSDKGCAYGDLEYPYIVAVRINSITADKQDVAEALYGKLQYQIDIDLSGEQQVHPVRAPDGYWFGGTQWRHQNVSAVLVAYSSLQPWTVTREIPTLWEHPYAERAVSAPPMWIRAVARSGEVQYREASVLPSDLFGLRSDWPGCEPFDPYSDDTDSGWWG